MATVNLSPTAGCLFQAFNTNGLPLNAGKLYTYSTGTTTPLATYTTSAGSVQNANPIILGTDGRTPNEVWLVQGSSYTFQLNDSLDSPIQTYNNITGINDFGSFTASTGSNLIGYLPGGTGALTTETVQTVLRRMWINVRDFGATGDGTTDDTVALQAAHTYAAAASSSGTYGNAQPWLGHEPVVYYPMGLYKITSAITIAGTQIISGCGGGTFSMSKIQQSGDGINLFRLTAGTDGKSNSTRIENMAFRSVSATSGANIAQISIKPGIASNSIYIKNCWFQTPETYGIQIPQGDDIQITDCTFDVCAENAICLSQASTGNWVSGATYAIGDAVTSVANSKLYVRTIAGAGTTDPASDTTNWESGEVTNCRITGCDFFQVALTCILAFSLEDIVIANNTLEACGQGTSSYFYLATSSRNVAITGNTFRTFNGTFFIPGVSGVPANSSNITITGNTGDFSATTAVFINAFGTGFLYNMAVTGNSIQCIASTGPIIIDNGTAKLQNCAIQGNTFLSAASSTTAITLSSAATIANKINNNVYINWTTPESINLAGQNGTNNTTASGTINIGSVAAATTNSATTINVSGAQVGDYVDLAVTNGTTATVCPNGTTMYADVTSAGVVTVHYANATASAQTFPSHTVYVSTRARAV